jgi:hypothetical protein
MFHQCIATNKQIGLLIHWEYKRRLFPNPDLQSHQVKIGCKANYSYRIWSADQMMMGAAITGALASVPL